MRLPLLTLTGAANSDPVFPKRQETPVNISLHLVISGTVDASVQYTIAPVSDNQWVNHVDLTNKTASAVGTIQSRILAYRLVYNSGSGTAKLHGLE